MRVSWGRKKEGREINNTLLLLKLYIFRLMYTPPGERKKKKKK